MARPLGSLRSLDPFDYRSGSTSSEIEMVEVKIISLSEVEGLH